MANYRSISADAYEVVTQKGRGQFSNVGVNEKQFMTENIDYRSDDATGEGVIKLSSLRSSLSNHAKTLSKKLGEKVSVKITTGVKERDTGAIGLIFEFYKKSAKTSQQVQVVTQPTQVPVTTETTQTAQPNS